MGRTQGFLKFFWATALGKYREHIETLQDNV